MAQKKKKTTKKSESRRQETRTVAAPSRGLWAVVFAGLGLISLLSLLPIEGALLRVLRGVLGGLFGAGSFLLPVVLLAAAVLLVRRRKGPVRLRAFCVLLLPVLLGGLIHALFWANSFEADSTLMGELLTEGASRHAGGLLGGLLFMGLSWCVGWLGAMTALVLLTAAALLIALRITPRMILDALRPPQYEYESEEEREYYEAPRAPLPNVHELRRSRKKPEIEHFNIALDSEPPAPPVLEDKPREKPMAPDEYVRGKRRGAAPEILDLVDSQRESKTPGTQDPQPAEKTEKMAPLTPGETATFTFDAGRKTLELIDRQMEPDAGEPEPIIEERLEPEIAELIPFPSRPRFEEAVPQPAEYAPLRPVRDERRESERPPVRDDTPPWEDKPSKAEQKKEDERVAAQLAAQMDENQQAPAPVYIKPPIHLLREAPPSAQTGVEAELKDSSARLLDTLESFNVDARIIGIVRGPSVTRFELIISRGIKFSRITALADDIALALGAASVRIATIPDKSAIGIEVPNKSVTMVSIRECIGSRAFRTAKSKLSFAAGKDITGAVVVGDIAKMPHLLIAGTTGSGKSVCVNSMLISLLYNSTPEEVRLIMVDPKMVELGNYNGIPHLLIPVVTDPKKAAGALNWSVGEMERRYTLFAENQVRDLVGYNEIMRQKKREALGSEDDSPDRYQVLPQIVIVIDELADLMMVAAKEVETSICRIAQKARAAGMHLIVATQRPSADVITGLMKANIPSRIAFAVASQIESRIILDQTGAEKLIGKGDMLYAPLGGGKPQRVQGCFITSDEIESVIAHIKESSVADYSEEILEHIERQADAGDSKGGSSGASDPGGDEDEMLMDAIDVVVECGQASVSMLQRRLKLGYSRAARIVDQMEERGIVGPFEGSKPRQILISREEWQEMKLRQADLP